MDTAPPHPPPVWGTLFVIQSPLQPTSCPSCLSHLGDTLPSQLQPWGLRGLGRHPSVPRAQSWAPSLGGSGGRGYRGQSGPALWNPCWGLKAAALSGFVIENLGHSPHCLEQRPQVGAAQSVGGTDGR